MKTNTRSITLDSRYYLVDLIRFTSAICLTLFHLIEFSETITYPAILQQSFFARHTVDFIKWICFHGHTVFFLSFFLLGFRGLRNQTLLKYGLFAIVGYLVILFGFYEAPYPIFYWDIYPFLIFTSLTVFAFQRFPQAIWIWLLLFLVTSLWNPLELQSEILGGICTTDYQSSWPLFPWLFIATFLFEWGKLLAKKTVQWNQNALQISTVLFFTLTGSALVFADSFQSFSSVSPTSDLYCKLQQLGFLEKVILLSGWAWIFQAAIHFKPQHFLLKLISKSAWNKSFGTTYLIHLIIISIYVIYSDFFLSTGSMLDYSWLGILVLVELLSRKRIKLPLS